LLALEGKPLGNEGVEGETGSPSGLDVYLHGVRVGELNGSYQGPTFRYGAQALDEPEKWRLSLSLPVRSQPFDAGLSTAFFDNLLPEGGTRDLLSRAGRDDPSDILALLRWVGGECAGAVSLWPRGEAPTRERAYTRGSLSDLERLFSLTDSTLYLQAHVTGRQCTSGTEEKVALLRKGDTYFLPRRGAPSNVILKRESERFSGMVQNELACLQLMEKAGVPVVRARVPTGLRQVIEVERFDRVADGEQLARIHQEDMCQASGTHSRKKYERNGGPGVAEIARLLVRHSAHPIADLDVLARWMIVNACIGNGEGHAKNLAIVYGSRGPRLAPVYDVGCSLAYPVLDASLAMRMGKVSTPDALTRGDVKDFALALYMSAPNVVRLIDEVTTGMIEEVDSVCEDVAASAGDVPMLGVLRNAVKVRSTQLRERSSVT
jgi:serine/threonine-protein kinase HipA